MNSQRSKSNTPDNEKDLAQTPVAAVRQIEELLGVRIVLDVCALKATAKAPAYICAPDATGEDLDRAFAVDALETDWLEVMKTVAFIRHYHDGEFAHRPGAAFMNPPFSRLAEFTEKAAAEARRGMTVIGCVKDDRVTDWYRRNVENAATFVLIPDGRIQFLKPDGGHFTNKKTGQKSSADFVSVFPVWMPFRAAGPAIPILFRRNWIKRGSKQ